MFTLYLVCAAAGSTLLVIMFLLTLTGLDGDVDAGGVDVDGDFGGDVPADGTEQAVDMLDDIAEPHADSTVFFHVLSLRSVVAAIAFFGLGGMLAQSLGAGAYLTFTSGIAGGTVAMFIVAWLMHLLYSLRHDGSFRIGSVVAAPATVYLTIPGGRAGVGKVTVAVPNGSVELDAMTDEEEIQTGSRVIVSEIINENTVAVKRQTSIEGE